MKKAMIALVCLISFCISIVYLSDMQAKDFERFNKIEVSNNSVPIYINEDSATKEGQVEKFKELSKTYGATFVRSDRISDPQKNQVIFYKSGVFHKDYWKKFEFELASGRVPETSLEFLATYQTGDQNQTGVIKDPFQDNLVVIDSLENFYKQQQKSGIGGPYILNVEEVNKENVIKELVSFFNTTKEDLLKTGGGRAFGSGIYADIASLLSIIIGAIFCLTSVFYPISKLKEIGVMKLQGYKSFDIWLGLNREVLWIPPIFYLFSFIIFQVNWIKVFDINYFLNLTLQQLVLFGLCFVFSLIMLVVIEKLSISHILKNFFNFKFSLRFSYVLKFLVFVALIFIIPQVSKLTKDLVKTLSIKSLYEQQKDYLTISKYKLVGSEIEANLSNPNSINKKFLDLYHELNKNTNPQYVYSGNVQPSSFPRNYETVKWKDVTYTSQDRYNFMSLDKNYFERLNKTLNLKLPMDINSIFSGDIFTVLAPEVPESEKGKYEYIIRDQASSYIYPDYDTSPKNIDDLPVRILYYPPSDKSIFSENFEMAKEGDGLIKNPIFLCLNDTYMKVMGWSMLANPADANPFRLQDTPENRELLEQAIITCGLTENKVEFESILLSGYASQLSFIQSGIGLLAMAILASLFVSVLSSFYIVLIILASKKKEVFVYRLLGYPLLERYKNEVYYFTAIYVFGLGQTLILSGDLLSVLICLGIILLDALIICFMVKRREKAALSLALKGEE